ncbi:hypothetical protein [Streptomyces virginiae]|uniref:hypothetical protein n=1 Tax=Streptomyces virginiae TaxID=1961 RepID=UPI0022599CF2|nr:hypothetical protein [Streptomyces virginiae]MCX4960079.1 hypothetical protein [Streptomyces virginiae]
MRKVRLLGIPQFLLAYVLLTVTSRLSGAGAVLQVVVLLASAGLATYGIRRACLLLRQARTTPLIVATLLVVLVLIRLVLWLAGT